MSWIKKAVSGIWDFVVGDDWRLAIGTVTAIGGTAVLVTLGVNAWWFALLAIPAVLGLSLKNSARNR